MVQLGAFERYLIEEFYDDYRDGLINRGTFTRRVAFIQGSMAAAVAMTAVGCAPDELPEANTPMPATEAATVAPTADVETSAAATPIATAASEASRAEPAEPAMTETGIEAEELVLPDSNEEVAGYFAKPAGDGPFPAVLVCHENRGLVDHIRDVTRRFAGEGYVTLALDLLWREGGTASFDRDAVPGMLTGAGAERHLGDFATAFDYLQARDDVAADRIGMTGYCFGGGIT